jgi:hypothetical protein
MKTIEPPPSIDNQEDPKEHNLCKFLDENVLYGKKYMYIFFLKKFQFSLVMYFTIYKSENEKNLLSEPSTSVNPPPSPKSYVIRHNVDLPIPEHIGVNILRYNVNNSFLFYNI